MVTKAKKIKKIVVATDFSKNADNAILKAIGIAKAHKANLTIITVIEKVFLDKFLESLIPFEIRRSIEGYASEFLEERVKRFSKHRININYKILPHSNDPALKILQYVKKNKIDLLVIGAHGKYTLRDTFVGTTAEYMVKRISCPVLVVKNSPKKEYHKILVPVDFSRASKVALDDAMNLFSNNKIHLVHVANAEYEDLLQREEGKTFKKIIKNIRHSLMLNLKIQMNEFLRGCKKHLIKKPYKLLFGYPGPEIIKMADEDKYDLIVMGSQGHGRRHYLLIGSVANWVLVEANTDVLLVPPKSKRKD